MTFAHRLHRGLGAGRSPTSERMASVPADLRRHLVNVFWSRPVITTAPSAANATAAA
jgi:hypothetical protein